MSEEDPAGCSRTHRTYLLTCEQYATVPGVATRQCAICGIPERQVAGKRLFIDHDNVRQLVKPRELTADRQED